VTIGKTISNSVNVNIGGVQNENKNRFNHLPENPRYRDDTEAASMAVGFLHYLINMKSTLLLVNGEMIYLLAVLIPIRHIYWR
jgi:predicted lipoprotein